jgi:hypothetical protein
MAMAYDAWAFVLVASAHFGAMLFNFVTNKDLSVVLRGHKGLVGTKLGLDEDLTPIQQVHKSKLWLLFKEAKVGSKRAFWHTTELFVDDTQICPSSSI